MNPSYNSMPKTAIESENDEDLSFRTRIAKSRRKTEEMI